ncbi:MAG: RHS domain-containing protein [Burkholderiales bacterium]|nr:RHS domain-containing protein [Burkholderiales bacterium]
MDAPSSVKLYRARMPRRLDDEVARNAHGPITRWPDNRIGHSAEALWRYDGYGNSIEEERHDGSRQRLSYDSAHQLTRLSTQPARPKPEDSPANSSGTTTSHYTYDALGRRLKKEVIIGNASADASTLDIHYHGWDGDRLIHTEHLNPQHPGERQITHTVYEPQSFTPMLRLSTRGKAAAKPHRLVQALQERADAPDDEAALASLQAALQALPASMQQSLNEATTQALEHGLPASALTMLGDEGPATKQHLQRMKKRLQEEEQQQKPPVEIHFYHCDHLGTPIALTDRNHHVIWAAKLDPWGNLEEEYNPNHIDQPIRLPGQHHDRETGLYYNRHRYYDPALGSYISQDPIGLRGGANKFIYPTDSLTYFDPLGLEACIVNFPDYPIEYADGKTSTWLGGHSGILTYDAKGQTSYFEYGRYPASKGNMGVQLPQAEGNIRKVVMPNLKMGPNGTPTHESMDELERNLSRKAGRNTNPVLTCKRGDPKKISDYVNNLANDKDRPKYGWNPLNSNHCRDFAANALKAGQ